LDQFLNLARTIETLPPGLTIEYKPLGFFTTNKAGDSIYSPHSNTLTMYRPAYDPKVQELHERLSSPYMKSTIAGMPTTAQLVSGLSQAAEFLAGKAPASYGPSWFADTMVKTSADMCSWKVFYK
jgi:hypothetical protein